MSGLFTPLVRLPSRIPSLVSLTSVLVQIQPISLLVTGHQPISNLHTTSPAHVQQKPAPGVWSRSRRGDQSQNCPIKAGENLNSPISNQYMCGNSYSSMAFPTVLPTAKHTATVIFLHGLGDTGHGWLAGLESIKEPHIKYVCPNAGTMRVTLNFGMMMPSWFDILSLGLEAEEDEEGIKKASQNLLQMIAEEEQNGIAPERIVIGGFSQGGGLALYTALTDKRPYAGVLALSTWLPLHKSFKTDGANKRSLPILQCHGTADPVLPFALGEMTHKLLETQVNSLEFHKYPGLGHSSSPEEMAHVHEFLKKVLP